MCVFRTSDRRSGRLLETVPNLQALHSETQLPLLQTQARRHESVRRRSHYSCGLAPIFTWCGCARTHQVVPKLQNLQQTWETWQALDGCARMNNNISNCYCTKLHYIDMPQTLSPLALRLCVQSVKWNARTWSSSACGMSYIMCSTCQHLEYCSSKSGGGGGERFAAGESWYCCRNAERNFTKDWTREFWRKIC